MRPAWASLLVVGALFAVAVGAPSRSPLTSAVTGEPTPGVRLELSPQYLLLSPILSIWDAPAVLSITQHVAVLGGVGFAIPALAPVPYSRTKASRLAQGCCARNARGGSFRGRSSLVLRRRRPDSPADGEAARGRPGRRRGEPSTSTHTPRTMAGKGSRPRTAAPGTGTPGSTSPTSSTTRACARLSVPPWTIPRARAREPSFCLGESSYVGGSMWSHWARAITVSADDGPGPFGADAHCPQWPLLVQTIPADLSLVPLPVTDCPDGGGGVRLSSCSMAHPRASGRATGSGSGSFGLRTAWTSPW